MLVRGRLRSRAAGVTLDPRYPNAHFALGLACMWTGRSERGIAEFDEAIKLNPSFAAAHVLLGQMYLYAGRPEETIELAEKGIRLSPSDPRLFIWLPALAGAHYQLRHYEQAVEIGRRSWTLNRNWPPVFVTLSPALPNSAESTRRRPRLPS